MLVCLSNKTCRCSHVLAVGSPVGVRVPSVSEVRIGGREADALRPVVCFVVGGSEPASAVRRERAGGSESRVCTVIHRLRGDLLQGGFESIDLSYIK